MNIIGVDFDYFMTRLVRYGYEENKLCMDISCRLKDETIDRSFTIEIPKINEYIKEAFKKEGIIDG